MNCIVFDLDGTLFDATSVGIVALQGAVRYCAQELNIQLEVPSDERICRSFGLPPNVFYRELLRPGSQLIEERVHQECLRRQRYLLGTGHGRLYSGIDRVLRCVNESDFSLYIASNGSPQYLEIVRQNVLSEYEIRGWLSCDGVKTTKAGVLRRLRKGRRNRVAAMVGDRREDALAASVAGVRFVWCKYGYEHRKVTLNERDFSVETTGDLYEFVVGLLESGNFS